MIIESCGSKETTKGTFLLIYLQSSLGQRQSPRYLSCLLLSEAQVVVPSVVPAPWSLWLATLYATLTFI